MVYDASASVGGLRKVWAKSAVDQLASAQRIARQIIKIARVTRSAS